MKFWVGLWLLVFIPGLLSSVKGQSFELQQLLLDVQKLAQEKQLLNDLYNGYEILSKGYGAIRDVSKGSFDLHKTFLDGLLTVSPAVKQYKRVADIINLQVRLVASYKSAWTRFRQDPHFTTSEIELLGNVYSGLISQTIELLNSLTMVLTDGELRADDGERIRQIDRIYSGMQDKWLFLQSIDNRTAWLSMQRAAATNENTRLKQLYGLTF